MSSMSSFKPYLFTAYYNWIVDNDVTPHLLIDVSVKGVQVPLQYAQNNSMVLSIAPAAIADYQINDKGIGFKARFHGESEQVIVPFKAMRQLIAFETGGALPIGQALAVYDSDDDFDTADYEEDEDDFAIFPEFKSVDDSEEEEQSSTDEQPQSTEQAQDGQDKKQPAFSFVTDD
ncbi:MAG: hypothetical protein K6F05_02615 [Succinivibrio sp.]|nr:hypothetical protein [Succinivibrio sp.]